MMGVMTSLTHQALNSLGTKKLRFLRSAMQDSYRVYWKEVLSIDNIPQKFYSYERRFPIEKQQTLNQK